MIILYNANEKKFDTLGLGVLTDAISAYVKEVLNDSFELEIEYPISGVLYDKLQIGNIISSKPNPFAENQPFRIALISKPINGIVKIKAYHISYDMNGFIVGPISGKDIDDTLKQLKDNSILENDFTFTTTIQSLTTFQTKNYFNIRSLLFGSNESILEVYKAEIIFDRFNAHLVKQRGSNKNCQIRYGKNMLDLSQEISWDKLYNGVYPYVHKETSNSNVETTTGEFTRAYIVGNKPLQDGWLSFTEGGEPYHPINDSPVQIVTEGEYYKKIYTWDERKQRYIERLYEETTTLVSGVLEPDWIYVDWSGIPNIVVKANKSGYFKMATDTEYKYYDKDQIVFKGSIRSAFSNLVVYYSEVIPSQSSQLEDVTESVSHTDMTDKILWLDTDLAKHMKFNRILPLNLTSEFKEDEEVNDESLKKKALKYIEENKIGQYKYNTKVSFIDLNKVSNPDVMYENFESIELGDTVRVIHEGLGVDVDLRVISATYNALTDEYDNIELGEKQETISSSSVQTGDSISSLSNDAGYTNRTEVAKIIASTITADFIKATNAELSKAQIDELSAARIRCTGILEASQFDIDKLVAKLLIADNAEIKNTLEAGTVKVSGDITIKSGEINIQNESGDKVFNVDRNGNLTATSATIYGKIVATSGKIGGFTIAGTYISSNAQSMDSSSDNGVYIGPDGISLGKQLKIYANGSITSYKRLAPITSNENTGFGIDEDGNMFANTGNIGGFNITKNTIENNPTSTSIYRSFSIKSWPASESSTPDVLDSQYTPTIETDSVYVRNALKVVQGYRILQSATRNNPTITTYFINSNDDDEISSESYKNSNGLVCVRTYMDHGVIYKGYISKIPAIDLTGIPYIPFSKNGIISSTNDAQNISKCLTNPVIGYEYDLLFSIDETSRTIPTGLTGIEFAIACCKYHMSSNNVDIFTVEFSNTSGNITIRRSVASIEARCVLFYIGYYKFDDEEEEG